MKLIKSGTGKVIVKSDYSKELIVEPNEFKQKGHQLQTVIIPKQTRQRKHYHTIQTELCYMLDGECTILYNNEDVVVKAGDTFIYEPQDIHYHWNKTDTDAKILVFKLDFPEGDDTVWIE
jgi:quercetin dioxygenase-like cupin family protein